MYDHHESRNLDMLALALSRTRRAERVLTTLSFAFRAPTREEVESIERDLRNARGCMSEILATFDTED